ncbi:conserved hypothetical protein [Neospora caninum Liverpool]|uniref:Uncharacterized protein n=1 Tax=Neospora caninum (strain Liverpool) TaxID=572307 RepID=F0V7Q9_NEOCL|nr:conserved hypothetical protein [Neospora caninum Liverpool]CBZ49750.1 conserved hypothetical protein [Neospora caninum Liverpool]|eukprot:XP_003879785.1 conserved hypothetical protein [Neospora caninum Liverpool]
MVFTPLPAVRSSRAPLSSRAKGHACLPSRALKTLSVSSLLRLQNSIVPAPFSPTLNVEVSPAVDHSKLRVENAHKLSERFAPLSRRQQGRQPSESACASPCRPSARSLPPHGRGKALVWQRHDLERGACFPSTCREGEKSAAFSSASARRALPDEQALLRLACFLPQGKQGRVRLTRGDSGDARKPLAFGLRSSFPSSPVSPLASLPLPPSFPPSSASAPVASSAASEQSDALLSTWRCFRGEIKAFLEHQRDSDGGAACVARLAAAIQTGQEQGLTKAESEENALMEIIRENTEKTETEGDLADCLLQRDLCLFKAVSTSLALEHLSVRLLALLLSDRKLHSSAPSSFPSPSLPGQSPKCTEEQTTLSARKPDLQTAPQTVSSPHPVSTPKETVSSAGRALKRLPAPLSPRLDTFSARPLLPVSTRLWVDEIEGNEDGGVSAWVYRQLLVLGVLSLLPRASGFAVQMPVLRSLLDRVFPTHKSSVPRGQRHGGNQSPGTTRATPHSTVGPLETETKPVEAAGEKAREGNGASRENCVAKSHANAAQEGLGEKAERTSDVGKGPDAWHPAVVFRVALQSLATCPLPSLPLDVQQKCWASLYFSLWNWDRQQHATFLRSSPFSSSASGDAVLRDAGASDTAPAPVSPASSLSPYCLSGPSCVAHPSPFSSASPSTVLALSSPASAPESCFSPAALSSSPFPEPPLSAICAWTSLHTLPASSLPTAQNLAPVSSFSPASAAAFSSFFASSPQSCSSSPLSATAQGPSPEVLVAAGQAVSLCAAREAVQLLQALNHFKHQVVELPWLSAASSLASESNPTKAAKREGQTQVPPPHEASPQEAALAPSPSSGSDAETLRRPPGATPGAAEVSPRRRSEEWLAGLQDLLLRVLTGLISAVGLAETRGILGALGRQEVRDAVFVHALAHRVAELMGEVPERRTQAEASRKETGESGLEMRLHSPNRETNETARETAEQEESGARRGACSMQKSANLSPRTETKVKAGTDSDGDRGVSEGKALEKCDEASNCGPPFGYSGKRLKLTEMHNIVMLAMKAEVYDQHLIDALARLIVGEAPPFPRAGSPSLRLSSDGEGETLERAQLGSLIGLVQTLGKLQARTSDPALFDRMMLALCNELHRRHAFIHDSTSGQVLLGLLRLRFVHPPLTRALALKTTRAASRQNAQNALQAKAETPARVAPAPLAEDAGNEPSPPFPPELAEAEDAPGHGHAAGGNSNHFVLAANMISRNGFYSFSLLQQVIKLQLTSGAPTSVLAMTQMLATLARFGDFQPADSHLRLLIRWCLPRFVAELLRRPTSSISPLNASQVLSSCAKLRYVDVPFTSHLLAIFTSSSPSSSSGFSRSSSSVPASALSTDAERSEARVEREIPRSSPLAFPVLPPCPFDIRACRRVLKTLDAAALVSIVEAVDALEFWTPTSLHLLYQIKCILEDELHDLKASQIIAVCLAFRDWHYRDWELPDAMVAGEALVDEATGDDSQPSTTATQDLLPSVSSWLGASASSLLPQAAPPYPQAPSSPCSPSRLRPRPSGARAAPLYPSPFASSCFFSSPLSSSSPRSVGCDATVQALQWLHRSAWKEELVLNCVEALERHESFALANWLCMQKLKTLVDAIHLDIFFPYFSWFQASPFPSSPRFSSSSPALPSASSSSSGSSACGERGLGARADGEEPPSMRAKTSCSVTEPRAPGPMQSDEAKAHGGDTVSKDLAHDLAPLQFEVLDLTPPVYGHPTHAVGLACEGETANPRRGLSVGQQGQPGAPVSSLARGAPAASAQKENQPVSHVERFQVLPPWLWRQLMDTCRVTRGAVEANRHLHDREGEDASDGGTSAREEPRETPLEASHPPVLHAFGHRGVGAVVEGAGPFRVFVGPFVRGMRVDVVVQPLSRGEAPSEKEKKASKKMRRKQAPNRSPESSGPR